MSDALFEKSAKILSEYLRPQYSWILPGSEGKEAALEELPLQLDSNVFLGTYKIASHLFHNEGKFRTICRLISLREHCGGDLQDLP